MATGKKFYWIKLRNDFMTGDIVDFLMSQKNGSQYVVLYQMLCLMCINTNGMLSRKIGEIMIPFDVDKIQRDCKYFNRDTIAIALELFKKIGLIYEQSDGILMISGFDNLIGSETDYAMKKRLQRQTDGQVYGHLEDSAKDRNEDNMRDIPMDNVPSNVSTDVQSNVSELSIQSIEIRDKSLDNREKSIDNSIITVSNETVCQTDVRRIVEAWNELQQYGIAPVSKLSPDTKRYKSLIARMKQYKTENVLLAIDRIKHSDFLQGKNKSGWWITFDWFVLPNNFHKVFEGNYDNKSSAENEQTGNAYLDKISNRIREVDSW